MNPAEHRSSRRVGRFVPLALAVALGGCASMDSDGAFSPVQSLAGDRLGVELTWSRDDGSRQAAESRVRELIAGPLDLDGAVEVALLNNRDLQADFDTLGVAEAERAQAGRLGNPGFAFGRSRRGDEREIERAVHLDVARLLFLPTVNRLEARRLAVMQRRVAMQVLDLAARTRKAWVDAVAASETARYMEQVRRTAEVSADLARRMAGVGNFNTLQQAREQSFYADAVVAQAQARHQAVATREALVRLLGLYGPESELKLPDRLPELPDEPQTPPDAVRKALAQRLDLEAARLEIERLGDGLGLVRTGRFVSVLELTGFRNSSNEEPTQTGWEIDFQIPIFDWGDARIARAEAMMSEAVNRAAQAAIEARSQVRQAYSGYRTSFDIARHYRDVLVPLRTTVEEEGLLSYNGMITNTFELLADIRARLNSSLAEAAARRDFWLADANLMAAVYGGGGASAPGSAAISVAGDAGAGH